MIRYETTGMVAFYPPFHHMDHMLSRQFGSKKYYSIAHAKIVFHKEHRIITKFKGTKFDD